MKKRVIISVAIIIPALFLIITFDSFLHTSVLSKENTYPLVQVTDISLLEGKYYLNGDSSACYFYIANDEIQFISTNAQFKEFYIAMMDNTNQDSKFNEERYLGWSKTIEENWQKSKEYIFVHNTVHDEITVAWHWNIDDEGVICSCEGVPYIDNMTISYGQCEFIRESVDTQ